MLTRIGVAALAGVIGLSMSACAGKAAGNGAAPLSGEAGQWLEVDVRNGTSTTVRVLALENGHETLLGRVDALSDRKLRFPGHLTGMIRLVARPSVSIIADRAHFSEPVVIHPGQRIQWELRASPGISDVPRISTLRVYNCPTESC